MIITFVITKWKRNQLGLNLMRRETRSSLQGQSPKSVEEKLEGKKKKQTHVERCWEDLYMRDRARRQRAVELQFYGFEDVFPWLSMYMQVLPLQSFDQARFLNFQITLASGSYKNCLCRREITQVLVHHFPFLSSLPEILHYFLLQINIVFLFAEI